MVTLQTYGSTGHKCPKCENNSVFSEDKYKFFGFVYQHTIEECGMKNCDYKEIIVKKWI